MKFENNFDVDAPLDRVWEAVLDVERVAPMVPGAQVLERVGDDAYKVAIKVKVGPMSVAYRGKIEITDRDPATHRALMTARAREPRGQGSANADVTMVLDGDDRRTTATVITELDLSGRIATMGQGVLQDVAGRLVDTFARNLAGMLAAPEPEPSEEVDAKRAVRVGAEDAAPAGGRARADDPAPTRAPAGANGAGSKAIGAVREATTGGTGTRREAGPEPAAEDALDIGAIGGAMLAERLKEPRVLAGLIFVAFLLGRRSVRR